MVGVLEDAPRPPKVVLSSSADYAEVAFVNYTINRNDPWATRIRVDPTGAKIVAANTELE